MAGSRSPPDRAQTRVTGAGGVESSHGATASVRGGCAPALELRPMWEGAVGKSQGRQPDSGNPTVRDERGGLGKRGHGSRTEVRRRKPRRHHRTLQRARSRSIQTTGALPADASHGPRATRPPRNNPLHSRPGVHLGSRTSAGILAQGRGALRYAAFSRPCTPSRQSWGSGDHQCSTRPRWKYASSAAAGTPAHQGGSSGPPSYQARPAGAQPVTALCYRMTP